MHIWFDNTVVCRRPALGSVSMGVSVTQSDLGPRVSHGSVGPGQASHQEMLGPGQMVIARPLALEHRRARERAVIR